MKVCMYLRKSRQDEELEKRENTDTLARHRSTLLEVAKKQHLDIIEVHEEIVSGGSIASRPKMLKLLEEVRNNMYDAVLCMDLDRLGRGGMQDQGLILDTFKETNTLIVTPDKTYDLNNELDEEMTEFKSFFARRELKMITKRMQRGRIKSIEEGKFIASNAPFGYKFEYDREGKRLLIIDEDKAAIVKEIFALYISNYGSYKIKVYLDTIGVKTNSGKPFSEQAIRRILKNSIYCGYVSWNKVKRKGTKSIVNSKDKIIYVKGRHQAIISEDMFNLAQNILEGNQVPSVSQNKKMINPLAGLIKCACCNHTMIVSKSTYKNNDIVLFLKCAHCNKNSSSKLESVENTILGYMQQFLNEYQNEILKKDISDNNNDRISNLKHTLSLLEKETIELQKQKNKLHDFLERGVYDIDTYLERTNVLRVKTEKNETAINNLKELIEKEMKIDLNYSELIPRVEKIINSYKNTQNILDKNILLKSVIEEVIYYKEKGIRNGKFELDIKLRLPI